MPTAGSPAIQETFRTSYATTAWVLMLAPAIVALVLEPVLFLAADRWPRRWFVRGGLFGLAACSLLAGLAPGPYWLAAAIAGSYVTAGAAVSLAQATLVDHSPAARERVMTRWVLMGLCGDLAGPALLAGLAAADLGWRAAYAIVAAVLALWSLGTLGHFPDAPKPDDHDDEIGLVDALRLALRDRTLLLWLAATALCDLLDEILVVFASLHLRDDLGAGPTERAIVLGAAVAGGAIGVLFVERLLRTIAPLRVLAGCALACGATYLMWLAAPTWWLSAIGMFLVGATASPLYPIAQAQCYAALPGRSGAVHAASHLFTPFGMALPYLLGLLADHAGTTAALLVLTAEPVGLAVIALHRIRSSEFKA